MDTFWGLSGTAWTAIYTILTALLVITAWIAAAIAWGQWKASRDAVKDARKAQAEASRPYVLVTAEPSGVSRRLFDLSIRNIGKRPALDLRVRLDPPPARAREVDGHEMTKMKMLTEPIAMLAPDQEMRAFWDSHIERNGVDLPTSHQVHLTYKDSSGAEYEETAVIDLDAMQGSIFTEVKTVHDMGKALEEISKVVKNAGLFSRHASLEVQAVTESYEANERRLAQEKYERLREGLKSLEGWRANRPEVVADVENQMALIETEHPFLIKDSSPKGSLPARLASRLDRLKARLRASWSSLIK